MKDANYKSIELKLQNIFESIGIFISNYNKEEELNLDSMQLVIIFSDIQSEFKFNIYEETDILDLPNTFNEYMKLIYKLKSETQFINAN